MPNLNCKYCDIEFYSRRSRSKFCSIDHWKLYNKEHPNSGAFPKGRNNPNKMPIGTISLRKNKIDGWRYWIKTDGGWRLLARYVWETNNGPIPKGYLVHHKNRNKLDDTIENLELQTRAQHMNEHREEFKHTTQ